MNGDNHIEQVDPDYFPGDPSPKRARWFLRGCAWAIVLLVVLLVVLIAKAAALGIGS